MTTAEFDRWLDDFDRRPLRTLVMGILNITPDSFSDGGEFLDRSAAADHARQMIDQGADLIDIGGESTRPGSLPVPPDEQIRRVVPAIESIRRRADIALSVDTTRAAVAAAALDAGAHIVNDISAGRDDPEMLPLVARRHAPVILMHMQGTPATMQTAPSYQNVTAEVAAFLRQRLDAAVAAGVDLHRVVLDPGIGFGKSLEHNLALLREMDQLTALGLRGRPVLIGTSRKGFIGAITGEADPSRRLFGTAATVAWSASHGAAIVRVHDVAPMIQVVRMIRAIQHSRENRQTADN